MQRLLSALTNSGQECRSRSVLVLAEKVILRHKFCSHLAMRGAPAGAVQELAGHAELGMTQRYMHLSPAALDAAIQLLERRGNSEATTGTSGPAA